MHSPPPHGHGYGYGGPPPPRSSSNNVLVIVLVIVVVLLVLGGGSCLLCVGLAAVADDPASGPATSSTSGSANGLERTPLAAQLEGAMKGTKVPVQQVLCPKEPPQGTFKCELVTTSGDRADVDVTPGPTGLAYDVPGMAFLEGTKLESTFRGIVASINPRLRVPCFTGVLMKKVGADFTCPALDGGTPAGSVTVSVLDKSGAVKMTYEGTRTARPARTATPSRTVDFVCPPGQAPGGAVRGGCVCGDTIIGTACGAPGNFTDVVETAKGCRFTCN